MAGHSKLANPEFAKAVAEVYVSGVSRETIADEFGVHKDTISTWIRDPRVQAHAGRIAQERVLRITRKIDAEIEGRVANAEDIDTELLLKIRKEFFERAVKIETGSKDSGAQTINDALEALEGNPDLARELQKLSNGNT